jgi:lipopolysaccharide/colanic/teichoic acid biosynthesis glycosyltransferase
MFHTTSPKPDHPWAPDRVLAPDVGPVRPVPRWKRWIDCAVAGPLLVFCTPVILAAIVLVRLSSPGPGIYSQTRLGLNRRRFTLYKIRTMGHNCEARSGARWATSRDPRVTLVGRFLRATHIDELPQLWNVLRGEMTLVGPRPERPEIVDQIEPLIAGYAERLTVLPGVTGLAQVQLPPDSSIDTVRRKLRYDVYYCSNLGPWLDARLILATAVKVFGLVGVMRALLGIPGPARVERGCTAPTPATASTAETAVIPFVVDPPRAASPQPDPAGA